MATELTFSQMGLDQRLIKAIAKLGWAQPTPVQEKAIPLAMEGRDLVVRAKTGSGKTASYAIPLIQKVLDSSSESKDPSVKGLVIVPSKELSSQATIQIKELCTSCSREVKIVGMSHTLSAVSQRTVLLECPDIVVGTPSRILSNLLNKSLVITDSVQMVVFDEADLLFSYGYEQDIKNIINYLPTVYQAILLSATLSEDVLSLKKVALHQPVTLKLEEPDLPEEERLTQYHIKCKEDDKFLLIYTLLKLRLVRGKTLMFVNDINKSYKLKLFLEQFSIKSCVLNSELPHNSRNHVVEEFNRGIYDYIIATDELLTHSMGGAVGGATNNSQQRKRKRRKDSEYGVARGIDFQGVENVINFDFPPTPEAYVHRVGRTARGFEFGTALMFVTLDQEGQLNKLQRHLKKSKEHHREGEEEEEMVVKPYRFKMSEIEGFRYRVQDALMSVSAVAIKEARLKEIRAEILSSNKLKSHFEENPRDLQVLRHDRVLLPHKVKDHLKHIPPYLIPKVLRTGGGGEERNPAHTKPKYFNKGPKKKASNDPLKTLKLSSENPAKKRKTA